MTAPLRAPDLAERLRNAEARIRALEEALRGMVTYFTEPSMEVDLRDPDFWEGSYRDAPSEDYLTYWRVVDAARALLGGEPTQERVPVSKDPQTQFQVGGLVVLRNLESARAAAEAAPAPTEPPACATCSGSGVLPVAGQFRYGRCRHCKGTGRAPAPPAHRHRYGCVECGALPRKLVRPAPATEEER